MKLGAENPKKVALAIGLLVVGGVIAIYNLTPTGGSSTPPPPGATQLAAPRKGAAPILSAQNLDPRLRLDVLASSQDVDYKGNGRNIFRSGPEPPKELPKPVVPVVKVTPPAPPPPPPINLKFFGFANRQGLASKIFLSQGDDVFVAGEGDIVNRRYRIVRIAPTSVEVEDVVNNRRQTLPLS